MQVKKFFQLHSRTQKRSYFSKNTSTSRWNDSPIKNSRPISRFHSLQLRKLYLRMFHETTKSHHHAYCHYTPTWRLTIFMLDIQIAKWKKVRQQYFESEIYKLLTEIPFLCSSCQFSANITNMFANKTDTTVEITL